MSKDLQQETAKMLAGASQNLAQFVASSSFEFWKRKDFRLYVDFDHLGKTEQDRMFNELQVSVLGLYMLYLDAAVATTKEERKIVFTALRGDLVHAFLQLFVDLGIEKQFVDQWKRLIDLRLIEYRKDLKIALKESSKWEEFKDDKDQLHDVWARIETITIDCVTHIRRGKLEREDPLLKLLRKWLITLDTKLHPLMK